MNRATMIQLVDALNKAVANGDKESMFRGVDELERYFNETGLDAWMFSKIPCGLDFRTCPLLSESTNVISR